MSDQPEGLFSLDKKTKSFGKQSQSYTPDPMLQSLNQFYTANIENLFGRPSSWQDSGYLGLGAYLPQRPSGVGGERYDASLFTPSAAEKPFISSMSNLAFDPESNPMIASLIDRTGLMDSMKSYFDSIIAPEIANNATISSYGGRGSSGYNEMATRYMAGVAPSIEQMYRQGLQAAPGMQTALMGNLGLGMNAAGLERQGRLQDYLNQLNVMMTASLGIPLTNYGTNEGKFSTTGINYANAQDMVNHVSSVGNMVGGFMGMGAMCWVAAAVYGNASPRFFKAREWIVDHWQGPLAVVFRAVYRRVGPTVAVQVEARPWLRKLVKPFFDWAVRRRDAVGG